MGLLSVLRNGNKFRKTRDALLQNYRIALDSDDANIVININEAYPSLNEHELAIVFLAVSSDKLDPSNDRAVESARRWARVASMALENGWVGSDAVAFLDGKLRENLGQDFDNE